MSSNQDINFNYTTIFTIKCYFFTFLCFYGLVSIFYKGLFSRVSGNKSFLFFLLGKEVRFVGLPYYYAYFITNLNINFGFYYKIYTYIIEKICQLRKINYQLDKNSIRYLKNFEES